MLNELIALARKCPDTTIRKDFGKYTLEFNNSNGLDKDYNSIARPYARPDICKEICNILRASHKIARYCYCVNGRVVEICYTSWDE